MALFSAMALSGAMLAACETDSGGGTTGGGVGVQTAELGGGDAVVVDTHDWQSGTINVWSFTDEVPSMANKFKELNPDFPYDFNVTVVSDQDGAYEEAIDAALRGGGASMPHIYTAESAFVLKYTQGDAAGYTGTYKSLGIDVDNKIREADIAPFAYQVGMNNGEVVGLPYQATGGAYIYRRSIAIDTWGTDDPEVIKTKIGPGWDQFMLGAAELDKAGYSIVSGIGDVWHPLKDGAETGWINANGEFYLDPAREKLIDIAKELKDNNYMNDTQDWHGPWFADMKDEGIRPVLGYFGPAWLINYVMSGQEGIPIGDWAICEPTVGFTWGGTWIMTNKDTPDELKGGIASFIEWITLDSSDDGLQYMWANGTFDPTNPTKDTVSSGVVMSRSNGELEFLGGQNMFDVFVPAGKSAKGTHMTQYDRMINEWWIDQVRQYYSGNKSRDEAIQALKDQVADQLGFSAAD